ncbi:MAG: DMT family transporter [Deltaproteobacteria bacterium]|nr:MAG: DMT family transporter [Deltaproteobacteria bacterium]
MLRFPLTMAFLAALLFGAATPASKALLEALPTFQLAGLLYLGAALGVLPLLVKERQFTWPTNVDRKTGLKLLGAIGFGGVAGPLLLLYGLRLASAASVSLWLNLELIATVLLGHFVFRDELSIHGWIATAGTLAAATLLSVSEGHAGVLAGLLVAAACFCWGLDNHLTALITGITPAQTTFWKGLVAGIVNLAIGMQLNLYGATISTTIIALTVGVFSYGVSIVLYIASAQKLGASRSQIVFSSSPFFGVILAALFLREHISVAQIVASLLIIIALGFLFFEQHLHTHHHEATAHDHWHRHDDGHHDHVFPGMPQSVYHRHRHEHRATKHAHSHWPDPEHRHKHE